MRCAGRAVRRRAGLGPPPGFAGGGGGGAARRGGGGSGGAGGAGAPMDQEEADAALARRLMEEEEERVSLGPLHTCPEARVWEGAWGGWGAACERVCARRWRVVGAAAHWGKRGRRSG